MKMELREIRQIIIIVFLSGVVGALVSLPVVLLEDAPVLWGMLKGFAAGSIIGFAARFAFSTVYMRFRNKPVPAYAAMAGIVGIGTFTGCLILQIESYMLTGFVILGSVTISIIMAGIIFRYSMQLNDKLEKKKQELNNQ